MDPFNGEPESTTLITFGSSNKDPHEHWLDVYIDKNVHDAVFKRVHYELKTKYNSYKMKTYQIGSMELVSVMYQNGQINLSCCTLDIAGDFKFNNCMVEHIKKNEIDIEKFPVLNKYDREDECSVLEFSHKGVNIMFINETMEDDGNGKYYIKMKFKNKSSDVREFGRIIFEIIKEKIDRN